MSQKGNKVSPMDLDLVFRVEKRGVEDYPSKGGRKGKIEKQSRLDNFST